MEKACKKRDICSNQYRLREERISGLKANERMEQALSPFAGKIKDNFY